MRIDPNSNVPIFLQIVNEMQSAIAAGVHREQERVPSARELAQKLKVNPNTVQKAYAELVELGVLESKRGIGKFVCRRGSRSALKQSENSVEDLLRHAVQLGRSAMFSDKRIKEILSKVLATTRQQETA